MATMTTTRWRPDTCGCEIEIRWDRDQPEGERTHQFRTVKACPHHPAGAAEAHAENVGKNRAIQAILEHAPDLKAEAIAWRWSADRRLILTVPGIGARRDAALAAARRIRADVEIE